MPITNPSNMIYKNMKQLVSRMRNNGSDKVEGEGLMIRKTLAMKNNNKESQGMDMNAKVAKVLMKIEDERNGTGTA
tara:strand:+ start:517 stop:744 length:228 start_codon:yes stop_codon:yes gene_type:complete